ncbi:MAG: transporter substrate-binding domain-containing protein [Pseudomonadota bacterium]
MTVIASADEVRIGTEGAYPPFNFINDNGQLDGFEIEMGNELCKRAKLDCTWVKNDWDSIIPNLVSGNYDAIIAGMSITEERKQVIAFSDAYLKADPSSFVALAGADDSVTTGVVAAQASTIESSYIAESDATLVEFATPEEPIAAVRSGEVDAVLANRNYLAGVIEGDASLAFVGENVTLGAGNGIGLRQSDGELAAAFNEAIASMKEDGSLNALIEKWFEGNKDTW